MKCVYWVYRDRYESVQYETNLLSELRTWAPAMALGIADPLVGLLGKFVLFRWIAWTKP